VNVCPSSSITSKYFLLTLSNPTFLPPTYSPALIYFGREIGWWITCNYPTVLKEKNISRNRKSTTCAICWLKSVLHKEKRREQENHNVGLLLRSMGRNLARPEHITISFVFFTPYLDPPGSNGGPTLPT
jgi:hypothetical protein